MNVSNRRLADRSGRAGSVKNASRRTESRRTERDHRAENSENVRTKVADNEADGASAEAAEIT